MQDKDLYQHILGLTSPWTVRDVKLDMENQEIQVQVDHPSGTRFCCPECQQDLPCYDHGEERQRRHLDSCQFKTILVARVPRVDCPKRGVRSVSVPWAEPHMHWTANEQKPLLLRARQPEFLLRHYETWSPELCDAHKRYQDQLARNQSPYAA
jgi:hypothetical protein